MLTRLMVAWLTDLATSANGSIVEARRNPKSSKRMADTGAESSKVKSRRIATSAGNAASNEKGRTGIDFSYHLICC
jgi:hypothetical protein